jgi:hypothetical protein
MQTRPIVSFKNTIENRMEGACRVLSILYSYGVVCSACMIAVRKELMLVDGRVGKLVAYWYSSFVVPHDEMRDAIFDSAS